MNPPASNRASHKRMIVLKRKVKSLFDAARKKSEGAENRHVVRELKFLEVNRFG